MEYVADDARQQSLIRYAVFEKDSKFVNYDLGQEDIEDRGSRAGVDLYAYLGLGDKDEALTFLERAYAEQDPALFWLKMSPIFDPLRSEPRFQALLRRVNFPQ